MELILGLLYWLQLCLTEVGALRSLIQSRFHDRLGVSLGPYLGILEAFVLMTVGLLPFLGQRL